jgi:hypothetical protein
MVLFFISEILAVKSTAVDAEATVSAHFSFRFIGRRAVLSSPFFAFLLVLEEFDLPDEEAESELTADKSLLPAAIGGLGEADKDAKARAASLKLLLSSSSSSPSLLFFVESKSSISESTCGSSSSLLSAPIAPSFS